MRMFHYLSLILLSFSLCLTNELCSVESLIGRNPFQTINVAEVADQKNIVTQEIPSLKDTLEFCGSHSIGGTRKFSILSVADGKTFWVQLSESILGYKFLKYNDKARTLLVEFEGKHDILPIRKMSQLVQKSMGQQPSLRSKLRNRSNPNPNRENPRRRRITPRSIKPPKVLPSKPEFPVNIPPPPPKRKPQQV